MKAWRIIEGMASGRDGDVLMRCRGFRNKAANVSLPPRLKQGRNSQSLAVSAFFPGLALNPRRFSFARNAQWRQFRRSAGWLLEWRSRSEHPGGSRAARSDQDRRGIPMPGRPSPCPTATDGSSRSTRSTPRAGFSAASSRSSPARTARPRAMPPAWRTSS